MSANPATSMPRRNGKPAPAPMAFPSRPAVEEASRARADRDNAAWERQAARIGVIVDTAREDGHAAGERLGYTQGYRWGLTVGGVAGAIAMAVTWLLSTHLAHWLP